MAKKNEKRELLEFKRELADFAVLLARFGDLVKRCTDLTTEVNARVTALETKFEKAHSTESAPKGGVT